MNPGVLSEPCLKLPSCLESASTPAWTHHFLFLDIFLIYLDKNSHFAVPLKGLSHEIDFKNVDENGQILALLRAAAGF
jgi:hypothetical protein